MIDLRSDTVTRPSGAMREAMMQAEVGDDVLGEDPTVLRLQERIAQLFGKAAALFVPSGTMANQLAIRCQTRAGDEVVCDVNTHLYRYESAAAPALSGVQFATIESRRGGFRAADLAPHLRPKDYWFARTSLVALENTHNHRGGEIFQYERMQEVRAWTRENSLRLHVDGARLWNASVETGVSFKDYGACADTLSLSFSKGLGAPVGSILVGDRETIDRAHRWRKMLGGGMRQSGILAAAALYGLDHHLEDLAQDHRKCRDLAAAVERCRGLQVVSPAETNILIVGVVGSDDSPENVVRDLAKHDIRVGVWGPRTLRMVTHRDVSLQQVEHVASVLQEIRG